MKTGMKINFDRCEFRRATEDFLGFRVGLGRIEPRARMVEAILNFPKPSKNTLAKWNGLDFYYHKYLPNYAEISSNLTEMLRKSLTFYGKKRRRRHLMKINVYLRHIIFSELPLSPIIFLSLR